MISLLTEPAESTIKLLSQNYLERKNTSNILLDINVRLRLGEFFKPDFGSWSTIIVKNIYYFFLDLY